MEIKSIKSGSMGVNTYFVSDGKKSIIIDSGDDYQTIKSFCADNNIAITEIYYTHAHFDHLGNAARFQKDGVKVYVPEKDIPLIEGDGNLGIKFTGAFEKFIPDGTVKEGDVIAIGGGLKVLETPGHTFGSVCYVGSDVIFSGDTLFYKCVGRTDLPSSDYNSLVNSVKKLYALTGDYTVYPGHGKPTTINYERKNNLFIRGDSVIK